MREITVNKFRATLKNCADQTISDHEPLRVTRKQGKDFVIVGLEDWEQLQETVYVLQNAALLRQIKLLAVSHRKRKGYSRTQERLDEINLVFEGDTWEEYEKLRSKDKTVHKNLCWILQGDAAK
jgi:antitoxin YefM